MIKIERQLYLTFSISAVRSILSNNCTVELTDEFVISMTAATEYLVAEILELAGNVTRDRRKVRITTDFIKYAIDNDKELKQTFNALHIIVDDNLSTLRKSTYTVLKQVHPDTSITKDAIKYMDAIIHAFIKDCARRFQLNITDISDILHANLVGDLATHAVSESNKAITRWKSITHYKMEVNHPLQIMNQ